MVQTFQFILTVRLFENVDLFKSWGVISFEMAPQFVSADDGTFLDSVIQNGYAFADRYDLAVSKNNKYGSKEDLRDALVGTSQGWYPSNR